MTTLLSPRPFRLCIFGKHPASIDWLESVLEAVGSARLALVDAQSELALDVDAARLLWNAGSDTPTVLRAAAAAFAQEDLILLRAGTWLPPYWFERLTRAFHTHAALVVSPLDNADPERAPLPAGASSTDDPALIDALCYAYARAQCLDWPTFSPLLSMWNGAALARIDVQRIQKYTLPQFATGERTLLLDYLYVADTDRALHGPAAVATDTEQPAPSPLGELREGVSAALARVALEPESKHAVPAYAGLDGKPIILHILHAWGGGAERFVRELTQADTAHHHFVLTARGNFDRRRYGEVLELRDGALRLPAFQRLVLSDPITSTSFANANYAEFLSTIVRQRGVGMVIVNSLIGHSLDALRTGLPCLYFVHDFYPLWPLLHRNLDDADAVFDAATLKADLAAADAGFEFAERDASFWLELRECLADQLLAEKTTLVAPSRAALSLFVRLMPRLATLEQRVIPHGLEPWSTNVALPLPAPPRRERLRLVVLGRVRRGKAAHLLRELLPALGEHADLFLLGAGPESTEFFGTPNVHILLNYERRELPRLLATVAPDAAMILPNFAETFSYTLSELNSLGIPVIATRLGALPERVREGENGFLVAPTPNDILDTVARLERDRSQLQRARAHLAASKTRTLADMAREYLDLLPTAARSSAAPDRADANRISALTRAGEIGADQRLASTFSQTIGLQQAELQRRSDWALDLERDVRRARQIIGEREKTIDERTRWAREASQREADLSNAFTQARTQFEGELGDRTRWAQSLNTELDTLRGSFSWRMTKPVRYTARKVRALRVRAGYSLQNLRSALTRLRGSVGRRGVAGTLRRIGDEVGRKKAPQSPNLVVSAPTNEFTPFAVPRVIQPKISIVIPIFNKIDYTIACLRSLVEHAQGPTFEVIVVDDCSSDASAERLAQIDGLHVHRNESNLGFVGSCNAGAALAQGEFVLFLNNDTVVTAGWLAALMQCFEQEPDAGLVGAKLVYPDGRLQEAGGIVFRDGSGWNYGRFDDPHDPRYDFRREADYCSGAAIMLRRDFFQALGGFDARYAPAYYEDTDLAFAVRKAGKKVLYEPRAVVIHFEGITSGTDVGSGVKRYQVINREKFLEKWKSELVAQPVPIDSARFASQAATFRAKRRVLIVDSYTPMPDHDSGSLRMLNIMRLLREAGCMVSFMPDNYAHAEKYTEALQELGVEALYHPFVGDPITWLRENGAALDLVVLSRHYVAINYIGLVRLYALRARVVFDTVDLHYLREERSANLADNAEIARTAARTKAQELKLMRECDITLVVSAAEKTLLAREVPQARIEVVSNVHEIYGCRKPFAERRDLVFVGSFQHPPNLDAVTWFVRDVFPLVLAQDADIRFHLIGSRAPQSIVELGGGNVIVHGQIPDITPFMDGCRVSIASLRVGAGVKGKINMAMSYGLPVVATTLAVEGMHLRPGEDVLVGDTPHAFADAVLRLYHDEALWQTISTNGLANVQQHFSFDAARKALQTILEI